jgi:hypothetical protein
MAMNQEMVHTGNSGIGERGALGNRGARRAGRVISGTVLVAVGYILSPLSWWNDLFVNVPIAYGLSYPFSLISHALFLPSFIAGYWITNIAGLVLMHKGVVRVRKGLAKECREDACDPTISFWRQHRKDLLISVLYTGVILVVWQMGWLKDPETMFHEFRALLRG